MHYEGSSYSVLCTILPVRQQFCEKLDCAWFASLSSIQQILRWIGVGVLDKKVQMYVASFSSVDILRYSVTYPDVAHHACAFDSRRLIHRVLTVINNVTN